LGNGALALTVLIAGLLKSTLVGSLPGFNILFNSSLELLPGIRFCMSITFEVSDKFSAFSTFPFSRGTPGIGLSVIFISKF